MDKLTADSFAEFFQEVNGSSFSPFPWQERLAERVIDGEVPWPEAIALPTAAGKTACIDVAVFALACQAMRSGPERTAPRRLFFVVDRRVIVDEAYEHARKLSLHLRQASTGVSRVVADRLRGIAGGDDPLSSFFLRGGVYRDDAWARTPLQPTVIATTVDQIGSRLLFRGYGRSPKVWPIHAGLAANDSLIILDEAHCAQPFLETLQAIGRYRQWAEHPLPSPFHLVVMSATPPDGLKDIFWEDERDRSHPVLGPRLKRAKPSSLVVAQSAKEKTWLPGLVDEVAQQAKSLVGDGRQAIGIIVNRVATAQMVYERLRDSNHHDTVLLTGRMRPLDRDDTVEEWLSRLHAGQAADRNLRRPVFVVATQTLEVGANLDFDALVSECASLDALKQRFGRLNRTGRDIPARGVIVIRQDQVAESEPDPVYGSALAATWNWLTQHANEVPGMADTRECDMAWASLERLLPREAQERELLMITSSHAPVMLPAYLDLWVQTSPQPEPSPDVGLFLHGRQGGVPDVQVCWRADLDPARSMPQREDAWIETLAACPPTVTECMPIPLPVLRRWLEGNDGTDLTSSDLEGGQDPSDPFTGERKNRAVVRWLGREDSEVVEDPQRIRPGDVIVIPSTMEGAACYGHIPTSVHGTKIMDLGDRANARYRRQAVLRLHPDVISEWPASPARERLLALAKETDPDRLLSDPAALESELRHALAELAHSEGAPPWLAALAESLARDPRLLSGVLPHPCGGLILRGSHRLKDPELESDTFSDEDDGAASGTTEVTLADHSQGVSGFAARYGEGCRLPTHLVEDLRVSGYCHDLGKADPRFQALLQGGNPWAAHGTQSPLAKSERMPKSRRAFNQARQRSRYPKGARHELLSVRLMEGEGFLLGQTYDPDLVLHLVSSHHGYCRPFAPVVEDGDPTRVEVALEQYHFGAVATSGLERVDSGVAERFWRLTRRYGWWGLAWLEAILRLADHRRSEAESRNSGEGRD